MYKISNKIKTKVIIKVILSNLKFNKIKKFIIKNLNTIYRFHSNNYNNRQL